MCFLGTVRECADQRNVLVPSQQPRAWRAVTRAYTPGRRPRYTCRRGFAQSRLPTLCGSHGPGSRGCRGDGTARRRIRPAARHDPQEDPWTGGIPVPSYVGESCAVEATRTAAVECFRTGCALDLCTEHPGRAQDLWQATKCHWTPNCHSVVLKSTGMRARGKDALSHSERFYVVVIWFGLGNTRLYENVLS